MKVFAMQTAHCDSL